MLGWQASQPRHRTVRGDAAKRCPSAPPFYSPSPAHPRTPAPCALLPAQVDVDEMLALNGLDPNATLAVNFKLKLPKWDASCPAAGILAALPSDTVE